MEEVAEHFFPFFCLFSSFCSLLYSQNTVQHNNPSYNLSPCATVSMDAAVLSVREMVSSCEGQAQTINNAWLYVYSFIGKGFQSISAAFLMNGLCTNHVICLTFEEDCVSKSAVNHQKYASYNRYIKLVVVTLFYSVLIALPGFF